jgi:hypothetical protein
MDGPEMARRSPRNPIGIHRPKPKNMARMLDKKVAIPPTATPMAATVPTLIFLGSGFFSATAVPPLST